MALGGVGTLPFTVIHARSVFAPYIAAGGLTTWVAWTALGAIYYVIGRTVLDLCRDFLDFLRGEYRIRGGDVSHVSYRRQKAPPYDLLTAPDIGRDFSIWQYALIASILCEVVIGWIALIAVLYVFWRSPYFRDSYFTPYNSALARIFSAFPALLVDMSFLLVVLALGSIVYRRDLGLTPLIQRWLGLSDSYPGQNTSPRWLNELAILIFGRPI